MLSVTAGRREAPVAQLWGGIGRHLRGKLPEIGHEPSVEVDLKKPSQRTIFSNIGAIVLTN